MRFFRRLRGLLAVGGVALIALLVLPWTPVPWAWLRSLAQPGEHAAGAPTVLVMMGGGGIPSESGLTRSYKLAEAAHVFPHARIIVAMPPDPGEALPGLIEQELIMRGIAAQRLQREKQGRNTREQAREVFAMLGGDLEIIGLVTSPEHMARTWRSFNKAGFTRLVALPSWAEPIKADLSYDEGELGTGSLRGAIGGNDMIKYKFWDNLIILIKCAREATALGYYRLMGWI
jgi:uncharacterized SAM-binding protein YcdF (DUF218 family)